MLCPHGSDLLDSSLLEGSALGEGALSPFRAPLIGNKWVEILFYKILSYEGIKLDFTFFNFRKVVNSDDYIRLLS